MEGQTRSGSARPGTRTGLGPLPGTHGVLQAEIPSKLPRRSSVKEKGRAGKWYPAVNPPMPLLSGSLWLHGMWGPPCPLMMSHLFFTWAVATTMMVQI
uniref:Inositol polyphosphate 5-phosphatase J n=1 Tax=Mus musculus TaxID=10090 RepID=D3Z3P9_MOUSE